MGKIQRHHWIPRATAIATPAVSDVTLVITSEREDGS
jgi:hypothetical protein